MFRSSPVRKARRQFVHRRLRLRLRMFALVFTLMLSIVMYDLIKLDTQVPPAIGAAMGGFVVGMLLARIANIRWHEEASQVVAKMDKLGIVVLVCYVAFAFSRRWIFGHWFAGTELSVVAMSFTAGVMLARLLFMRREIIRILKSQEKY
ncbi:hypothetical protein [Hymenobacter sp. GOD-10R]|uniref:hypothetical protein n=1 Tax=Hymenobacter sp. GOD-10R TaxID=3093922 RepID=UPI002D76D2B0|nr:hypothetical protein [Hymenobacter sp. GOD-10R]WRQ27961.1 hypothetical protein SD425_23085 [Hymenobacter sp. GOD-10R]